MKNQQPNNTKYWSGLEPPANSSGNNPIQQKTINNRFANFNTAHILTGQNSEEVRCWIIG